MQDDCSLPTIFSRILKLYSEFKNYEGSSKDCKFQDIVSDGCATCQKAVQMVNDVQLFSKNESLDDLSSSSIRYLTLPAFLGYFTSQTLGENRLFTLQMAETFYQEFMTLVDNYGIPDIPSYQQQSFGDVDLSSSGGPKNSLPKRMDQAALREQKINMYKEKKALEKSLDQFDAMDQSNVDEEFLRGSSLSLVRYWAYIAVEELRLLSEEIAIISKRPPPNPSSSAAPTTPRTPTAAVPNVRPPLLITRDKIRATVFGAGYPCVPTMTLDQFYEMQVEQGILPPPSNNNSNQATSISSHGRRIDPSDDIAEAEAQKAAAEDAKTDAYCSLQLAKARAWDEFKDENRRGSGNRMNRG